MIPWWYVAKKDKVTTCKLYVEKEMQVLEALLGSEVIYYKNISCNNALYLHKTRIFEKRTHDKGAQDFCKENEIFPVLLW